MDQTTVGDAIQSAFLIGFPSPTIASILGIDVATTREVGRQYRAGMEMDPGSSWVVQTAWEIERQKVMPVFKMVDTCAGEFESHTPYYYGTFEQEDDALPV